MRDQRVYQGIWVLKGEMEVSLADEIHRLREGDCLAMPLDRPAVPQPDAQTGTLRGRDRLYAHGFNAPQEGRRLSLNISSRRPGAAVTAN